MKVFCHIFAQGCCFHNESLLIGMICSDPFSVLCSCRSWSHAPWQSDRSSGLHLPDLRPHSHPQRRRHILPFSGERGHRQEETQVEINVLETVVGLIPTASYFGYNTVTLLSLMHFVNCSFSVWMSHYSTLLLPHLPHLPQLIKPILQLRSQKTICSIFELNISLNLDADVHPLLQLQ